MSRIALTGGFTIMPEGEQILCITKVEYDESFGRMSVTMQNADGQRHFENFRFLDATGAENQKAIGAFSSLAKAAIGDSNAEEVDTDDLVGCFVKAEISHREYEDKDGKMRTATQKAPGSWWETPTEEEVAAYEAAKKPDKPKPKMDLNSILGR